MSIFSSLRVCLNIKRRSAHRLNEVVSLMTFDARPMETIRTGGSNGGGAATADVDRNLPVHLIRFFHFTCGAFKEGTKQVERHNNAM
jgi:hypothetical protein